MLFLKLSKLYNFFSIILAIAAVFCLIFFGIKIGIDFTGGSVLKIEFDKKVVSSEVEAKLNDLKIGEYTVQPIGEKGMMIKMQSTDEETHKKIITELNNISKLEEREFDMIGPVISQELKNKTILLVTISLLALLIYIAVAFFKISYPIPGWQYGFVSTLTLSFDLLMTLGVFAIFSKFFNAELTIPIVTALLAILGYMINDKIVVFDRVRENLLKTKNKKFDEVVGESVNQTFGRSIGTSITTILVLIAIYLFASESLKWFSLTLIVGIIAGTYSSLFIASYLLILIAKLEKKI